ncbi:unnamed protein product [Rotaria sp. Silwood1]|nr:unnamed protein product [Rotaria sp. Silwood1]CAF3418251.1 unnamed protein product [Rotaria sp. Silwood1]CAF4752717.1 unnamed protein product [Rotaria sp. Silwood1]CAF4770676.1 unnamed protein product [Rotaria sp. Silwood1]
MSSQNHLLASENKNGEKWNQCLTDSIIKTASGLTLGLVFSALLFKRRPWPVFFGTGIGIGMAYSNCQNELRSPKVHSQSLPIIRPDRHVPTVRKP